MGKIPRCAECKTELNKAPAKWDGEPTFVGYYHCPNHPKSKTEYWVQLSDGSCQWQAS